jgi:hypothetical protein
MIGKVVIQNVDSIFPTQFFADRSRSFRTQVYMHTQRFATKTTTIHQLITEIQHKCRIFTPNVSQKYFNDWTPMLRNYFYCKQIISLGAQ